MNLVTWNSSGGFRKKIHLFDSQNIDLLIIQECENPVNYPEEFGDWKNNYLWEGENKNKGIGIFSKNFSLARLDWKGEFTLNGFDSDSPNLSWKSDELRQFLPFQCDKYKFIAVWTKGKQYEPFRYIGQFWKFLQIFKDNIKIEKPIILGDFNSNVQWDSIHKGSWWRHGDVLRELDKIGYSSLYHNKKGEEQGEESVPTFYHRKKIDAGYHIDHVFMDKGFIVTSEIDLGHREEYLDYSDHVPIFVEIQ